jgi:predicted transcriptional regulator of viral defense system
VQQIKPMPPDPEAAVLDHVQTHGSISRREAVELWDLSENQVAYLLKKLVEQGELQMVGRGRAARYKLGKSRKISE